jgi:hypothetical protein
VCGLLAAPKSMEAGRDAPEDQHGDKEALIAGIRIFSCFMRRDLE